MPEPRRFDVIVAGVGTMGAAACHHLAKRGASVLGLEQFSIPHTWGAHHGHARMIRQAYFEHPDYVPLLKRSYELWHELEQASGSQLLHQTGGLYLGGPGSSVLNGSLRAARAHDLPHTVLSHAELRKEFPQFHLPDDFTGFFEERAGFLVPERAVCAHAEEAMKLGAVLHGNEPVLEWRVDPKNGGVEVITGQSVYRAGHLVLVGGAWSESLVRGLGVSLTVTRQLQAWFWPVCPERFRLGEFPSWFIETEPGFGHYGFPLSPGQQPGLKIALHKPGEPLDATTGSRAVAEGEAEAAYRPVLKRYLPEGAGPLLAASVCLYTNSPDGHFIVDRHPEWDAITVACGFSGHGFKFAPVIGEMLAGLALDRETSLPTEFLGLARLVPGPE